MADRVRVVQDEIKSCVDLLLGVRLSGEEVY